MKKYFCSLLLSIVTLSLFPAIYLFAQSGDISSDVKANYTVQEDGVTKVEYVVTLENIFTDRYAKSYTLRLEGTSPENIMVTENQVPLEFTTESFEQTKSVTIAFPEAVVGKGNTRTFTISYLDKSIARKNGDVWDIAIPRLGTPEVFNEYVVRLTVPEGFGDPAYLSPAYDSNEGNTYEFSKQSIATTGIHAAFGKFQTYEVKLKYHLENPLYQNTAIDIAIPPDTSYQKVYLRQIEPRPSKLSSDEDGNWIATYELKSRQSMEVNLTANVQVFNSPIQTAQVAEDTLISSTKGTKYWQIEDPRIKVLAQKYRTPQEIYDYVVRTLSYDTTRVIPNADRLGAVGALENPTTALCTEFTDLFIAMARAAGIPAREINGYAYSNNSSLQPLSLVTDVLHAWPEYWDAEKKVWVAVDPTWGSTTGGVDYFNVMDLKHIAFAIHGKDDTLPYPAGSYKLGTYPEKNVTVSVGSLPEVRDSKPELSIKPLGGPSLFSKRYEVSVYNPGPAALYNLPVEVINGARRQGHTVDALLPYGSFVSTIVSPVGILASDLPEKIEVSAGSVNYAMNTDKADIALYHAASLLVVVLAITVGFFIYLNSHTKLFNKWKRS